MPNVEMSPLLTAILPILAMVVWDILRKKFPWLNGLPNPFQPNPAPGPSPVPGPGPTPSPAPSSPLLDLAMKLLAKLLASAQTGKAVDPSEVKLVGELLHQVAPGVQMPAELRLTP